MQSRVGSRLITSVKWCVAARIGGLRYLVAPLGDSVQTEHGTDDNHEDRGHVGVGAGRVEHADHDIGGPHEADPNGKGQGCPSRKHRALQWCA